MKWKTHKEIINGNKDVLKHQLTHIAMTFHQNMSIFSPWFLLISGGEGPLILLGSTCQWQHNWLLSLVEVGCLEYSTCISEGENETDTWLMSAGPHHVTIFIIWPVENSWCHVTNHCWKIRWKEHQKLKKVQNLRAF